MGDTLFLSVLMSKLGNYGVSLHVALSSSRALKKESSNMFGVALISCAMSIEKAETGTGCSSNSFLSSRN